MTIPLDGKLTFAKLDASQTSRPHVFLLTSREPLKLTLDSFTRATTEVDFQARAKLAPGGAGREGAGVSPGAHRIVAPRRLPTRS